MQLTKALVTVAFALFSVAGPALAADLGAPRESAPLLDFSQPSTFTGGYVGVEGSLVTGDYDVDSLNLEPDWDMKLGPVNGSEGFTTGLFGFHAGYDFQISPKVVLGIVGDIGWMHGDAGYRVERAFGDVAKVDFDQGTPDELGYPVAELDLTQLVTVRGRLGYLVSPNVMLYGTGGVAVGWVDASLKCVGCGPAFLSESADETYIGYAVGGGAEYRFADNWSAGLEYLYVDLGKEDFGSDEGSVDLDSHIFKVKLSYRIN
jgi:outer membrane immunogenic protein